MAANEGVTAGVRAPLSRERISRAAVELIDQDGLEGLSMRKLGNKLGVEAMSLYHYVSSKDDLLDAVTADLLGEIEIPEVMDGRWDLAYKEGNRLLHRLLTRHPRALPLFARRSPLAFPQGLEVALNAFDNLKSVGLTGPQIHIALHTSYCFVVGHATEAARLAGDEAAVVPGELASRDSVEDVVRAGQRSSDDAIFEAGLDCLVAGISAQFGLPIPEGTAMPI